jgi:RNA polymerase sigma factor (sigma-70 family)
MAMGQSPAVLRDIHTLFHDGTSNGLTDAQLLDRFRARSDLDSSEAAFAGLMARHGPMVLGVCRRALRNPDDVADAFQATFLILVRKAGSVRVDDSLGRWLYGVSRRVSVRAKLAEARRSARQVPGVDIAAAPANDAGLDELRDVLDEEIGRLPEKFRSAVVLCELEGFGHHEAARRLGCAAGTVKSRLSRAREKLRSRLIRRGIAPAALSFYVGSTSASVPAELMATTISAATGGANALIPPAVTLLIQGVLRAMLLKKMSMIAATVVAGLALASGTGVWARQRGGLPKDDQPGGQRDEGIGAGENEARSTARQSTVFAGESKAQTDAAIEQLELLLLDVELLEGEVEARKQTIHTTSQQLIQMKVTGHDPNSNELLPPDVRRTRVESLQKELNDIRREWILKKRELGQKELEVNEKRRQLQEKRTRAAELEAGQRPGGMMGSGMGGGGMMGGGMGGGGMTGRGGIDQRAASRKKTVRIQPTDSDGPGNSPMLEKRLTEIEGKLDKVLKALEALKPEPRQ